MTLARSPVVRLTLWYVLLIMVISLVFSGIIYNLTAARLREGLPPPSRFFEMYGSRFAPPFDQRVADIFEERYKSTIIRLRWSLALLNISVLVSASVASYFLAKRTLRPIEQALEDQRRFSADASHELRTPLAAMKAEIEIALKGSDAHENKRVLQSNLEEIGRLERLSNSLLTIARHDHAEEPLEISPINFQAVAENACRKVEPMAGDKGIIFEKSGLQGQVLGNASRLTELLVILLDNAVKYSPENTTVKLSARWKPKQATVTVADQGIGIKAGDLPHVFDRFYRADISRSKQKVDGHGLGLSIAKQIVDQHHGSIAIESEASQGTTVIVNLPSLAQP